MDILFDFGYYVTLFFLPIAFYSVFLKNIGDRRFYNNRDWFYIIKRIFATVVIKKYQKKFKQSLDDISRKNLEYPKKIESEISSDSQFIYGVDQKGNSLSLRFTIRYGLIAEIFLCLRLENGTTYTFPGEKTPKLYSMPSWQWKTKNLNIEILEPFKRLRVTYNGLLSNANDNVEHVQFNFIWTAASSPKFYPQDAPTALFADILAQETWKDGEWITLLGDERGYGQFGALHGFVRGDSFSEEKPLNLPSCRTRFWGTMEKLAVTRSVHLFIAGKDGTLITVWAKALKKKCQGLKYGIAIKSDGTILPITKCDIKLECLGQNKTLPLAFTVQVAVKKKVYKSVFHLKLKHAVKSTNEESRGYELSNVPADCDLNIVQAKSLVEFWYARRGGGNVKLPPPLLVENKTKNKPKRYVSALRDEESKMVKLTGGKGCSLAILSCLKSYDFTVPDGFVVTVNAYNKQLEDNFNMRKAVAILDDICCGRTKGNLEQACAVTVRTFKNERILRAIVDDVMETLQKVKNDENIQPTRWAVRSSAVGEDSAELSSAGQNDTILGCKSSKDVIKAISSCWSSLFTYQSVRYRHQHGLPVASEMAVVVQRMVPADCAGVLFTYHPSTGNPAQIVITSNHGLGESVVSGKSEPDTIVLQRTFDNDLTIKSKTLGRKNRMIKMAEEGTEEVDGLSGFSITDNQALVLGRVGCVIEEAFGDPRDIEWAFYQGRLFLLQSRPVTSLNSWTEIELLHELDSAMLTEDSIYSIANVGEVLPGAISVLTTTTSVQALETALQRSIVGRIDRYASNRLPIFQHHMFVDLLGSIHRVVGKTIELSAKILDLAILGHPVINESIHSVSVQRFGVASKWVLFKYTLETLKVMWDNVENVKKIKEIVQNYNFDINEHRDTVTEMYEKINSGLEKMAEVFLLHSQATRTSVSYQIFAMTVLAENNEDFTVDHYNDIAAMLSSCNEVVSVEVPTTLGNIVAILSQNNKSDEFMKIEPLEGRQWLKDNCPEASNKFEEFLQNHGHRTLKEFDISQHTWAMKPDKVIKMIQTNCKKNGTKQEKIFKSVDEVINNLVTPKKNSTRKILKFLTNKSRRAVGFREQTKSEAIRFIDKFRKAYRKLARKMALTGLLPDKEMIFNLTHHEVGLIIEGHEHSPVLISKAWRRQKLYPQWDQLRYPEIIYGTPKPESDIVFWTGNGNVKCTGTPACAGIVKARACVINDLSEIHQLEDGDILITFSTDIAWSPYFPMLSGIVTELGGLVSHGAVVAREYGLPCIVGAQGATKLFKTGDIIVLSGRNGTIELFNEPFDNSL